MQKNKGLEYVEEMKELTFLQIENGKNNLIKLKNDLIERFKKNDRRKKADEDYYEYEENMFHELKDVKPKKELIECAVTKGIIKQEYAVDYDVSWYKANYRRCERIQEIDYVKYKPNLINDEHREVEIVEIIEDNKVEFCEIIEDRKAEHYQLIEGPIESYELTKEGTIKSHEIIEEKIIESYELIEDQEDIN